MAKESEYWSVIQLIKEFAAFIKTPEKVSITVEQMIQDKEYFNCLVAVNESDEIVGFATYFYTFYSWTGKSLYLDDLFVPEQYRGKKIGSRLLDQAFEIAKRENCRKIRWQVSNWNAKAIAFYKQKGATIDETEINCDFVF